MHYTAELYSSELENRFDVRYYDPSALGLLRIIKDKSNSNDYEVRKLAAFGNLKKGIFSISASEYKDAGVPFIRVSCIKYLTIDINDITYLSADLHDSNIKTEVSPGDIVISKSGTVGNIALVPEYLGKSNISQDIVGLYVNDKNFSGFLAAYLSSKLGKIQMQRVKTQQTHAHLTLAPLRELLVVFNKECVNKVSDLMEKAAKFEVDFFTNLTKAQCELEQYFNIDMNYQNCSTFQIPVTELESKFSPTFYYPPYRETNRLLKERFETTNLWKIAKIIKGKEVGSKNYSDHGIPFIRTSDLVNHGIDRDSHHKINKKIYDEYKQDLRPNDILFTNDGKIGLSAMCLEGDDCVIQSHIKRIRIVDDYFTPEFIFIFLNTKFGLYQIYRRIFVQSTIPTIEDGLNYIDIPYVEKDIIDEVTCLCKEAFNAKNKRNQFVDSSRKIIENELI